MRFSPTPRREKTTAQKEKKAVMDTPTKIRRIDRIMNAFPRVNLFIILSISLYLIIHVKSIRNRPAKPGAGFQGKK